MAAPVFCELASTNLRQFAEALRCGRIAPPYSAFAVRRLIPERWVDETVQELRRRNDEGLGPEQIAGMLELLAQVGERRGASRDSVDLVWTGPEGGGIASRDTAVVVRELFQNATRSVLVAGYAIYRGHIVFRTLADRMYQVPELRVRMFLNVKRTAGDTSNEAEIVRRFAHRFKA